MIVTIMSGFAQLAQLVISVWLCLYVNKYLFFNGGNIVDNKLSLYWTFSNRGRDEIIKKDLKCL